MATQADFLTTFIDQNLGYLIIGAGAIFLVYFLLLKTRSTGKRPDYIKIMSQKTVDGQKMNKPDKLLGVKYLLRGQEVIGKIRTYAEQPYKVPRRPGEALMSKRYGRDVQTETTIVVVVTFSPVWFKLPLTNSPVFKNSRKMLYFSYADSFEIQGKGKLVFPTSTMFTNLGEFYMTQNSYEPLSIIVQAEFNKQLFTSTNNLMSSEMERISAIPSDNAIMLNLEREKIKQIQESKKLNFTNLT